MVEFTWSIFHTDKMQRANLLDWLQNLQVVAALRSAMLIFLQVLDERRFGTKLVLVFRWVF